MYLPRAYQRTQDNAKQRREEKKATNACLTLDLIFLQAQQGLLVFAHDADVSRLQRERES